jgi:AcrR family transcriptional regulator
VRSPGCSPGPRVPRAGLSTQAVVAEAVRLVDENGRDRLTLAALAKRFGVALPSLYKHVAGIDDLHRRLAVAAVTDLGTRLRAAATGRSGTAALGAIAAAYRAYAREHPGCYGYLLRAAGDSGEHADAAADVLDVLLQVLAGYDLAGDDAVDAARFLRSTVHGFVSLESAGGFGLPRAADRSFEKSVEAVDRALQGWARARVPARR